MQTALVCAGFFAVAYLTRQLAQRLAYQERQARTNRQAARTQTQVNSLIVANLSEGVVVVDRHYQVRMANPAACEMLGLPAPLACITCCIPSGRRCRTMVDRTYASGQSPDQRAPPAGSGPKPNRLVGTHLAHHQHGRR